MGCAEIPPDFGQPGRAGGAALGALVRVVPLCDGRGFPWVPASCPRLGGYRQSPFEDGIRHRVRGAELHPGVSEQRQGDFPVGIQARWSHGLAPHPRGQHCPAEEPNGSPKKSITCFNFGIRQEEDGFVSSATPFQLFPERQRLEEVAGPNYNIGEPAPAALLGSAPAAGTGSSSRALRVFLPAVPWMAPHRARLRMGGSGVTAGGVWAGAGTARPQCRGVGVMGSGDTALCRGRRRAPAVRPRSRSGPAPSQIADGDKKLIAGSCCTWQERGRAAAPSFPSSRSRWSSAPAAGGDPAPPARKVSCCSLCPLALGLDPARLPPLPCHPILQSEGLALTCLAVGGRRKERACCS